MVAFANDIEKLLPQTQCTKCGYADCKDYALAIQSGEKINRCPPGGKDTIIALAKLTNKPVLPLDKDCGKHGLRRVAIINEELCIGCKKCILACPVDAIIGSKKLMHTVIEDYCTGCDLCVEPCPMDCIDMSIHTKQPPRFGTEQYTSLQKIQKKSL